MLRNQFSSETFDNQGRSHRLPFVNLKAFTHKYLNTLVGKFAVSSLLAMSVTAIVMFIGNENQAHAGSCAVGQVKEVGTWTNPDSDTRGITRAVFEEECRDNTQRRCNGDTCTIIHGVKLVYTARLWGQCHPTDCYWGEVEGVYTSSDWLRFRYDHGFAERVVWAKISSSDNNRLRLIVDTDFSSNSRDDYRFSAWLRR
jgi:hypothetical protein